MDSMVQDATNRVLIPCSEGNDYPKDADGVVKTVESFTFNESWAEIEKLLDTGKIRAIGVSNFSIKTYFAFSNIYIRLADCTAPMQVGAALQDCQSDTCC